MPRSKLGPLALETRLGDPQSNVWRAIHVTQRIPLVVKIFSVPFSNTPQTRKELIQEWEDLKAVYSPGIARCLGGGFEENDAYLAYEWLDGETLQKQISRRERLPWDLVLEYADLLIDGLVTAHDQQIYHGSIEPEKIMCLAGGAVKLLDLRSQRFSSRFQSPRPISSFQLAFRPPELLCRDPIPNAKSDLYSFGAVLYFAVTGRAPANGKTQDEVLEAIHNEVPPAAATLVMDCPIWFSSLLDQLLAKEPHKRPHGAMAVRLALQEVRIRATNRSAVAAHAAGGFSPLKVNADRSTARQLLGRAEQELDQKEAPDSGAFYEKWWFLLGSLGAIMAMTVWLMLPPSPDKLRRKAEELLASESWIDHKRAQTDYLEPLLRIDPDGPHAAWVQAEMNEIEIEGELAQLDTKIRRGTPFEAEGERLYAQALRFEQFGDLLTARDRYRAMRQVLDSQGKDRVWFNAANRRIAQIESDTGGRNSPRQELLLKKLGEAEQMIAAGKLVDARVLLQAIIELYRENVELMPLVERAEMLNKDISQR
jgi:eukaryotic-like serine/threonine-protein kinase